MRESDREGQKIETDGEKKSTCHTKPSLLLEGKNQESSMCRTVFAREKSQFKKHL